MSGYKRIGILLGAFLAIALILAACGGGPTPAPVSPATPTPKVEEPTAAPTQPPPTEEAAAEDLLDEVLKAGKLVVSTDPNYAPQSFLNDAGELDGFDVDVAKEVAKRLGVEVEFVTPEWDIITSGNWSARWDVSIGSMTPTEPRAEVLWFTDPYYYVPAAFAVHKDNTDINSPADLSGKRVGLGTATT
ncbi:MAG: transporter substrate-binding domain-containing protein, partial [Chloroflexi bacterium]|nr:transporter substrate-binding domain-containing protein [Chloroflexota bacterium]